MFFCWSVVGQISKKKGPGKLGLFLRGFNWSIPWWPLRFSLHWSLVLMKKQSLFDIIWHLNIHWNSKIMYNYRGYHIWFQWFPQYLLILIIPNHPEPFGVLISASKHDSSKLLEARRFGGFGTLQQGTARFFRGWVAWCSWLIDWNYPKRSSFQTVRIMKDLGLWSSCFMRVWNAFVSRSILNNSI